MFQTLFKPTEVINKTQNQSNFLKTAFNKLSHLGKDFKTNEKFALSNPKTLDSSLLLTEDSAEIMIKKFVETYLESYIELSKTALNLVDIRKPLMTALNEELTKRGNNLNEAEQLIFFEEMEYQQPFIVDFALTAYISKSVKDFYRHLGDQAMSYPSAETIRTFLPSLVEALEENIEIDFPSYSLTQNQLKEKVFMISLQIVTNSSKPAQN